MTVQEAARKILEGNLVVFPTETVYGLGALANNNEAVQKIFDVKGRPQHNPLILHIAESQQVSELVREIPPSAKKLIDAFWPGPLTICLLKSEKVSDLVSAGLPTVCIRNPSHPIAHELLKLVGKPIAAPSANLSGRPSTTNFSDAKKQLDQQRVSFLDGGEAPLGLESTVVDCSSDRITLLRPGTISAEAIEKTLGEKIIDGSASKKISSPGQLLEHYAPRGKLTVIRGNSEARKHWRDTHPQDDGTVFGIVADAGGKPGNLRYFNLAEKEEDLDTYAARLYRFLNWCDQENAETIIVELPSGQHPLFDAILNRLEKASRGNIITV